MTGIPTEGYAFLMGQFLCIVCTLLIIVAQANACRAAEFYSWTDPSGAVVITDDPKQMPPAEQRHGLTTHQLPNVPPAAESSGASNPSRHSVQAGGIPDDRIDRTSPSNSQAKAGTPDINEPLADILLEQPEGASQQQYVWVPLQTPFAFGSQTLTGFWSHQRVVSPTKAFQAYLRRHGHVVGSEPTTSTNGDASSTQGLRLGVPGPVRDPVYEQVRREREAIQQRGGLLYPSDAAPHPSTSAPASNGSGAARR